MIHNNQQKELYKNNRVVAITNIQQKTIRMNKIGYATPMVNDRIKEQTLGKYSVTIIIGLL